MVVLQVRLATTQRGHDVSVLDVLARALRAIRDRPARARAQAPQGDLGVPGDRAPGRRVPLLSARRISCDSGRGRKYRVRLTALLQAAGDGAVPGCDLRELLLFE